MGMPGSAPRFGTGGGSATAPGASTRAWGAWTGPRPTPRRRGGSDDALRPVHRHRRHIRMCVHAGGTSRAVGPPPTARSSGSTAATRRWSRLSLSRSSRPGARTYDSVQARVTSEKRAYVRNRRDPTARALGVRRHRLRRRIRRWSGGGVSREHSAEHDMYDMVPLDGAPTPTGHREQFANVVIDGVQTTGNAPS